MKKKMYLLIACMLIISALVACGGEESNKENASSEESVSVEETKIEEPVLEEKTEEEKEVPKSMAEIIRYEKIESPFDRFGESLQINADTYDIEKDGDSFIIKTKKPEIRFKAEINFDKERVIETGDKEFPYYYDPTVAYHENTGGTAKIVDFGNGYLLLTSVVEGKGDRHARHGGIVYTIVKDDEVMNIGIYKDEIKEIVAQDIFDAVNDYLVRVTGDNAITEMRGNDIETMIDSEMAHIYGKTDDYMKAWHERK